MRKIEDIEKLRGFACILVFIQHIIWICPYQFLRSALPDCLMLGSGGVRIFFAISGFVITLSIREKFLSAAGDTFIERLQASKSALISFYKKRFFRIAPVVMLTWIVLGLFLFATEKNNDWMAHFFGAPFEIITGVYPYVVDKFAFVQRVHCAGTGPFWTLAVELQFYIIWPIVLLLCKNDNIRTITSLFLGSLFLFVVQPIMTASTEYQYYAIYNNVAELFFGAFFAMIYDKKTDYTAKNKIGTTIAMLVALTIIWTFPTLISEQVFYGHTAVSIAGIFALVLAVFCANGFNIPVVTNFLSFLGKRSYSFYVVQLTTATIIAWFTNSIYFPIKEATPFLQFLVFVCALSLVTEIVYNLVEKPSRKLGQS